ncbi:arsenosugar biosynthesis arsenite methyltransferase ArsM [Hyalangium sp.]|uniref:arsenosugar biosynthesis arsenite methyltransferase ArsM n=1 Tax=Hyalangium sp. TaxID=2028555 RepID=UPI002D41D0C7|nr:arsenosugar biosynthesis arsenite methyltransferase ArsM [Hyalangium sp.]HYH95844.1 arsenosugar biosynthesis arsenite methyltransferase ArsM [Hyalangium sp.]
MGSLGKDEQYLDIVRDVYAQAATTPQPKLCCTTAPIWQLPGLKVPTVMQEMNYGCGTTVHPADIGSDDTILYVGVGGGMEVLQLAYFARRPGGVIAVDAVGAMLEKAQANLQVAAEENSWFEPGFVSLREGDALALPVPDISVDLAAQNCLFNVFTREHLDRALSEMYRVLKPRGRLSLSDPIATRPIPAHLAADPRLRAECLSGALTYEEYMAAIVRAGFGTVEVRARVPYRVLDRERYGLDKHLLLESVEVVAIKDPMPEDGPCVFTGRTAIYFGPEEVFDDGKGHLLSRDLPLSVCDKTAEALQRLESPHFLVTGSTFHYRGGGSC